MNHSTVRNLLAACSLVVLAACSSGVKLNNPDNGSLAGSAPPPANNQGVMQRTAEAEGIGMGPPAAVKRSIYFDFDSFVVKDDFQPVLQGNANWLKSHPNAKVTLQGNTDERGGSEYNLALGQKRAEAVRKALSILGVPDSQMEATSFGKEKPKALGHDEASWAENRRVDFAY